MLWVQLQTMKYAHGHLTFHGQVPFIAVLRFFNFLEKRPSDRAIRWQRKSLIFFAKVVQGGCFWLGKGIGIQGQYPEYTPQRHDEMKKTVHESLRQRVHNHPNVIFRGCCFASINVHLMVLETCESNVPGIEKLILCRNILHILC